MNKSIKEPEIDVYLRDLIKSDKTFGLWLINNLSTEVFSNPKIIDVQSNAVVRPLGQTDILIKIEHDNGCHFVLIENKINAMPQPDQLERYYQRGEYYVEHSMCNTYSVALISPKNYTKIEGEQFDTFVYYEEVFEWLKSHTVHDVSLLDMALKRASEGYVPEPDANNTDKWLKHWRLTNKIAKELRPNKPTQKPKDGFFINFYPAIVKERYLKLEHKIRDGKNNHRVDLTFKASRYNRIEVEEKYRGLIEPDMNIVTLKHKEGRDKFGPSSAVRIQLPDLAKNAKFEEIEVQLTEGILAAKRLYQWYLKNHSR